MKLGIMQPYFFPYLGYFDLIHVSDRWVVFDTPQYARHGWVNRNRVLHPVQGWQYILVPVRKHSLNTAINDIEISGHADWKARIAGQLQHYRKKAPYFRDVMAVLEDCFELHTDSLSRLNVHCLQKTCEYLGITFHPEIYSQMDLSIGDVNIPGDWALQISAALGADEYLNPPGGRKIFEKQAFEERGIKLTFNALPEMAYDCDGYSFEPGLSIIDVMMWNAPTQVMACLDLQQAQ